MHEAILYILFNWGQREDEQPQVNQGYVRTSIEFLVCPTVLFHIVDREEESNKGAMHMNRNAHITHD